MSSYFIVIPTGNKKENQKWVNGGKLFTPLLQPPTLPSCVYSDYNDFIH